MKSLLLLPFIYKQELQYRVTAEQPNDDPIKPYDEKTCLLGLGPGCTQIGTHSCMYMVEIFDKAETRAITLKTIINM